MSLQTRSPVRTFGAVSSGSPDTGEQLTTRGGTRRYSVYSGGLITVNSGSLPLPLQLGSGGHVNIWSGAGRLNTVIPHQYISGAATVFYDAASIAGSGVGTFATGGYAVLGIIPANSFNGTNLGPLPPIQFDTPFMSGLSVSAPSGSAGFTVTWTPEMIIPTNPIVGG